MEIDDNNKGPDKLNISSRLEDGNLIDLRNSEIKNSKDLLKDQNKHDIDNNKLLCKQSLEKNEISKNLNNSNERLKCEFPIKNVPEKLKTLNIEEIIVKTVERSIKQNDVEKELKCSKNQDHHHNINQLNQINKDLTLNLSKEMTNSDETIKYNTIHTDNMNLSRNKFFKNEDYIGYPNVYNKINNNMPPIRSNEIITSNTNYLQQHDKVRSNPFLSSSEKDKNKIEYHQYVGNNSLNKSLQNNVQYRPESDDKSSKYNNLYNDYKMNNPTILHQPNLLPSRSLNELNKLQSYNINQSIPESNRIPRDLTKTKLNASNMYNPFSQNDLNSNVHLAKTYQEQNTREQQLNQHTDKYRSPPAMNQYYNNYPLSMNDSNKYIQQRNLNRSHENNAYNYSNINQYSSASNLLNIPQHPRIDNQNITDRRNHIPQQQNITNESNHTFSNESNLLHRSSGNKTFNNFSPHSFYNESKCLDNTYPAERTNNPYSRLHYNDNIIKSEKRLPEHMNMPHLIHDKGPKTDYAVTQQLQMKPPDFSNINTSASQIGNSTKSRTMKYSSPYEITPKNFSEISKKLNYIEDLQLKNPDQHIPLQSIPNFNTQRSDNFLTDNSQQIPEQYPRRIVVKKNIDDNAVQNVNNVTTYSQCISENSIYSKKDVYDYKLKYEMSDAHRVDEINRHAEIKYPPKLNENKHVLINEKIKVYHERNYANTSSNGYGYGMNPTDLGNEHLTKDIVVKTESLYSKNYIQQNAQNTYKCVAPINFNTRQIEQQSYGSNIRHPDHQITSNVIDRRPSPTMSHQWSPMQHKQAINKQDDIYLNTQRNLNSIEQHNSQYISSSPIPNIGISNQFPPAYYGESPNQINAKMQFNNMLPPPANTNYNKSTKKNTTENKNHRPNYRELINNYYAFRQSTTEDELNRKIIERTLKLNPPNKKSDLDPNKNQAKTTVNTSMPIVKTTRDLGNSYPETYLQLNPGYEKVMVTEKPKEKPPKKLYMENQRSQHQNDINVTISKINSNIVNECFNTNSTNIESNRSNIMQNKNLYPNNERPVESFKSKIPQNNLGIIKSNAHSPLDLSVKTIKTKADSTGCAEYKNFNSRCNQGVENPIITVPKINFFPNFASATIKTDQIQENLDQRNHEYLQQPINTNSSSLSSLQTTNPILPNNNPRSNSLMRSGSNPILDDLHSYNSKYVNSNNYERSVEHMHPHNYDSTNKLNAKTSCQFVNVIKNVQTNERETTLDNDSLHHQNRNEYYTQYKTTGNNNSVTHSNYTRYSNDSRIPINHNQIKIPIPDQYNNQINYSHYPTNYNESYQQIENNSFKIKHQQEQQLQKPMDLNIKHNIDMSGENKREFSVIQNIPKPIPNNPERFNSIKNNKKNYSENYLESKKQTAKYYNASSHEPINLEKSSPHKQFIQQSNQTELNNPLAINNLVSTEYSNGSQQQIRNQPVKSDIASLIAARIRTKGELKIFVPTPPKGNKIGNTSAEFVEVIPTTALKQEKSDSSLNLNDWSFACNDFVEQLQTGTVNKKRTKKERSIIIQNPTESIHLINFPGKEYSGDVDKKLIDELRTAKIHGSNNTSDDEPLNLLKQKTSSTSQSNTPTMIHPNQNVITTNNKRENDRNIRRREKQRRYEEKRLAARLSNEHSTSSDSDSGDNHLRTKRSRKIPRKSRSKIDQNSNSDISSGSENDSINDKWKFSEIQDNLELTERKLEESSDTNNQIIQKEYMTKGEMKYMSPSKEIFQEIEVKIEPNQNDISISKSFEESDDNGKSDFKIKTNEKIISLSENTEIQETMTRSRKRKQLEIQIANSKVLRNKIIKSPQFEKYSNGKSNLITAQKKSNENTLTNNNTNDNNTNNNNNNPPKTISTSKYLSQRLRSRTNYKINEKNKKANLLKIRLNNKNKLKLLQQQQQQQQQQLQQKQQQREQQQQNTIKTEVMQSSKFPPGWEHAAYEYKKSLKIPLSLICIKGCADPNKKASKSLPDLDSHSSDFSEISDRNNKILKNIKTEPKIETSIKNEINNSYSNNDFEMLEKPNFEPSVNKHSSIIDLLHSRVIKKQQALKKNKSFSAGNSSNKSTVTKKTETEILSSIATNSPHKNESKLELVEKQHHNVFETKVLTSRTRTESKVLKNKELIREIFGGDDRPASAPPDYKNVLFADKYEEFLAKMNTDFGEKIRKTNVKQEKFNDEGENVMVKIEMNDESKQLNEESNESTLTLAKTKKINKYRNFRRKGSSGFDYIRKKKKVQPVNNNSNSQDLIKKRKKLQYLEVTQPRNENEVSKEIQKWVLNKSVGQSALHKAARLGYLDVAAYCLERMGMNPDSKDNAGYTPLHEASSKGRLDIARVLLEYGANHSAAAHSGIRPLHEAVENGHIEIVRLLLSYGADPLLTTYSGQTPLMLAEDPAMEQFIKNHLNDVQSMELNKQPWRFPGPWKIFDPDDSGFDLLGDAPEDENFIPPTKKLVKYNNLNSYTNNIDTQNHEKLKLECYVTLCKDITYEDNQKEAILTDSDSSSDDSDKFLFEESDAPLPPLYLLRDEGLEQWVLLQDLCNLLKVKSKETLLKMICPSPQSASVNKELLRELKVSEFLEQAVCLQLMCAGEKINMGSSKVILIKYNDRVKNLLGVKTVTI